MTDKELLEVAKTIFEKGQLGTTLDSNWISVKDRLPEPETWVIVYLKYPLPVLELERGIQKTSSIKKMFYDGKSFYCDYGNITHWMPLPEPPKENDEE